MTKKTKLKSLEDIALDYGYFLIDTCVLRGILIKLNLKFIKERLKEYQIQKESFKFWQKNIKYYRNCYTISEVIEELRNINYSECRKNIDKHSLRQKHPIVLEIQKAIKDANKERNLLIRSLRDEQRIWGRDREEQNLYEESYEKHYGFKTKYNLNGADFPLLISGFVAAQTRGSSAILSNDFGIARAWNALSEQENFSTNKFGFFVREDLTFFKKLKR